MSPRRAVMVVSWVGAALWCWLWGWIALELVPDPWCWAVLVVVGASGREMLPVVLWVVLVAEVRLGWLDPEEAARWVVGGEEG